MFLNKNIIANRIIALNDSLLVALRQMDTEKVKILFVFDNEHFISILTIGDIQRAIVNNIVLSTPISKIVSFDKKFAHFGDPMNDIRHKMLELRAECMPVLDNNGELVDVIFWKDFFEKEETAFRPKIDLPVVIMAGGKGTRLKPITNVIPKPLVPVGEKTILEVIMDQFESIGCHKFYMSVNYKADMMKYYLNQLEHHYDIEFFMEDKPLGTIGSVSLLKGKINTPFFVSNCDSINEQERYLCEAKLRMEEDLPHYSDANFTMRLSYGQVKEYNLGGQPSGFQTKAPSMVEKMKRGETVEDYKVEPEMINLLSNAGQMPLCFLTTNDITGGNSGSPMFDAKNRLIGLAFDGNWDSLSSDIFFDSKLARCIGVDMRYVLFMMDKWGHADRLINEIRR